MVVGKSVWVFLLIFSAKALGQVEKDISLWSSKSNPRAQIQLMDSLVGIYKNVENKTADEFAQRVIDLSTHDCNKLALALNFKSELFAVRSVYDSSIVLLDSAILLADKGLVLARLLKERGEIKGIQSHFDEGYLDLKRSLAIATAISDNLSRCQAYVSFGELYRKTGNFDLALQNLDSAAVIIRKNNYRNLLAVSLLDRYAAVHTQISHGDTAKLYSLKALALATELNDAHSIAVSNNELGYIYEHSKVLDSAIFHYQKAIDIWGTAKADIYTVNAMTNLGRLYARNDDNPKAREILEQVESMVKGRKWYATEIEIFGMLSAIYAYFGDSVRYFDYQSKHRLALLGQNLVANERRILEMEFDYSEMRNSQIIKNQELEIELGNTNVQMKTRQANQFLIFLIMLGILLTITLYLLRKSNRQRKKISQVNNSLENALGAKEILLKEVHHRVKNNLQMISSLLALQARSTGDVKAKEALLEGQSRIHAMSLMHRKLYMGSEYNYVEISGYLKDVMLTLVDSSMRSQDVFRISETPCKVHIEQAIPLGFILHELITNSMKHAWHDDVKTNRLIDIRLDILNDNFTMEYSDNGRGLPPDFQITNATSLGLQLVDLFVHNQLDGKLNFRSDQGAHFDMEFKLRSNE